MNYFDKLPVVCMSKLWTDGSPIIIKRGESGYYPAQPDSNPDDFNKFYGVTPAQVAAMEIGSMCGWEVPGANPDNWRYAALKDYDYNVR
jgi:hypothetical protein